MEKPCLVLAFMVKKPYVLHAEYRVQALGWGGCCLPLSLPLSFSPCPPPPHLSVHASLLHSISIFLLSYPLQSLPLQFQDLAAFTFTKPDGLCLLGGKVHKLQQSGGFFVLKPSSRITEPAGLLPAQQDKESRAWKMKAKQIRRKET